MQAGRQAESICAGPSPSSPCAYTDVQPMPDIARSLNRNQLRKPTANTAWLHVDVRPLFARGVAQHVRGRKGVSVIHGAIRCVRGSEWFSIIHGAIHRVRGSKRFAVDGWGVSGHGDSVHDGIVGLTGVPRNQAGCTSGCYHYVRPHTSRLPSPSTPCIPSSRVWVGARLVQTSREVSLQQHRIAHTIGVKGIQSRTMLAHSHSLGRQHTRTFAGVASRLR